MNHLILLLIILISIGCVTSDQYEDINLDINLADIREGSRTDAETIVREEEAIKLDGLNRAQINELREKAEKFTFQTEVNRMMKLIINSLYRNKEIFLRELISNASDALDKIRLLALTKNEELDSNPEMKIQIKADKDNRVLHITDTGIGMTKSDLIANLGTIAKSGTAEFLSKMQEQNDADQNVNDMIGQFGVGFYSAFLVADKVIVTSKHNYDQQHIWESDANKFSIVQDPRGDTLKRGTTISLYLKEEAQDFLEEDTIKQLIRKYSQFINFPIYMWVSKTVEEESLVEKSPNEEIDEEDGKIEEEVEELDKKNKKITKTIYDWELINDSKPIWTRKPNDVNESDYVEFYKSLTKDTSEPLTYTHFIAEGEVTFKSLLFIPKVQPSESFNKYGTKSENIKLFVRRVFITDEFNDMIPNYLNFIRGVVDSDDLPLNVSRETLQQHKLIKVIKKKLIRKALDMLKKLDKEMYSNQFWKEYSTNIKLGIMEDPSNRSRLAKLLLFQSSFSASKSFTSLTEYVERMKENQTHIYYIAASSRQEAENSPFSEALLKKGYEILYLVEAVDEYAISALPEFDGKKFQNIAKEGMDVPETGEELQKLNELKTEFEPLTKWLSETALKDKIAKAQVSNRMSTSPCALVASLFGWTGNMERLALSSAHQKSDDPQKSYYLNQKKTMEINPFHPVIQKLLSVIKSSANDDQAKEIALMLFRTATIRSGYMLPETSEFADSIDKMMRQYLGLTLDNDENVSHLLLDENHDHDEL